jgi:transposase InsO family protein
MRTDLIQTALREALATRGSLAGAIFHSDHGSQYTCKAFAKLCTQLGVTQSMGAVGTSADNALAEAFNATLKRELLQGASTWPDELTCRRELFRWATRYNTRRRHSWCGQQPQTPTSSSSTPLRSRKPPNHHPACPRSGVKARGPRGADRCARARWARLRGRAGWSS